MTGGQSFVGFAGAALVFANFWLGGNRQTVAGGLFGTGDTASAHKILLTLGGEMLLVVVMTIIAGASDALAPVMVVLILGLWLLWAMNRFGGKTTAPTTGASA
jgi:hypothetical protein